MDFDHKTSPTVEGVAALPRSMMARPKYPKLALDRERQRDVFFELTMVEDGLMKALNVVTVDPEGMGFAPAAVVSMHNVIFHPALPARLQHYEVRFRSDYDSRAETAKFCLRHQSIISIIYLIRIMDWAD